MDKDLKPCPFCGADAIVEKVGGYPHGYDVHCINDDCHCSLIYHETHHHAVKAWNTRTHNIQSYILGEQDAAEGLANLFEHYGYERAAKDIREEAAKWLTQENREIVSGRYRAEVPVTDHKYNIGELKANIRTHIPDFDMATQIMGVLSAKEPQRETVDVDALKREVLIQFQDRVERDRRVKNPSKQEPTIGGMKKGILICDIIDYITSRYEMRGVKGDV